MAIYLLKRHIEKIDYARRSLLASTASCAIVSTDARGKV